MKNQSDEAVLKPTSNLSTSILEAWISLPPEVRAALVSTELGVTTQETSSNTPSTKPESLTDSSITTGSSSSDSDDAGERSDTSTNETVEICPSTGSKIVLKPLERAPMNVFEFTKSHTRETTKVEKTPAAVVTTKTSIMTRTRGWRNVFTLPISYDVTMIPRGTILDPTNPSLLEATGNHPEGYNRRFAVVDDSIERLYGEKIRNYFTLHGIELTTCVLSGGEADKRPVVSFPCFVLDNGVQYISSKSVTLIWLLFFVCIHSEGC